MMKKFKLNILLKNISLLVNFLTNDGKIYSKDETLLSTKQHRIITKSIKYARILKLLPFKQDVKVFSFNNEKK